MRIYVQRLNDHGRWLNARWYPTEIEAMDALKDRARSRPTSHFRLLKEQRVTKVIYTTEKGGS